MARDDPRTELHAHERPILLVLPFGTHPAEGFRALLAHGEIAAWHLPAPWALEPAGLDVLGARPSIGTLAPDALGTYLDTLIGLATPEALEQLVLRVWREAPEEVRGFYLRRPLFGTLAQMVGLVSRSRDVAPPPEFVEAQVSVHRFELEYRLARAPGGGRDPRAPAEEGSLVLYPFDPTNRLARREAGLSESGGPLLEAFAYAEARDRHRRVLREVAVARGWQVLDG